MIDSVTNERAMLRVELMTKKIGISNLLTHLMKGLYASNGKNFEEALERQE